ncbi:unnamed protein product [Closterium sp. NIES-65]|nr:unnamed protein product [Closterium sp. NIES-65]
MMHLGHQFLRRGCSIRKIRLGNLFVRMTRSTSHLDDYLDVFVLVIVSRKSKTNPNNKLSHQFLARHRDWRLCGMGHVFLWLYFIYDLVPLRYGPGIVEPLDLSEPILWTKAHLFFSLKKGDQGKQKQDEMHYKTHNTWIKWAMTKARWIMSKVTHAFCRSGAQQLHDDGCSDNDIGTLGGWAEGELRRCYVFGIPFKPVWLLAGFSGDRGDYYIGRARAKLPRHKDKEKDEWLQLLDLLRLHIFPWVEEGWKKVEEWNATQTDLLKRHYAGARFLETLASIGRLVVAQDLAMMWAFCHQHVWVQPSLIMGGRSLREVFAEFDRYKKKDKNSSFITAYSRFAVKGRPGWLWVHASERCVACIVSWFPWRR